jgi:hypothetical protein
MRSLHNAHETLRDILSDSLHVQSRWADFGMKIMPSEVARTKTLLIKSITFDKIIHIY